MSDENQVSRETIEIASETMCRDLLSALLDEIRLLPRAWSMLPEQEQGEIIERLRNRVTTNVDEAVRLIASDRRVVVLAELESLTFKDGVKATLRMSKTMAGRHDMADAVGSAVMVLLGASSEGHKQGLGEVAPDPDQAALGLDAEAAAGEVISRAMKGAASSPPPSDEGGGDDDDDDGGDGGLS